MHRGHSGGHVFYKKKHQKCPVLQKEAGRFCNMLEIKRKKY